MKKIGQSFSCFKRPCNIGKTIISKHEKLLFVTKKKPANISHLIYLSHLTKGLHFLSAKTHSSRFYVGLQSKRNTNSTLNLCENSVNVTKRRFERWHKDPRSLYVAVFLHWMLTAYSGWYWSQLMNRYQARIAKETEPRTPLKST